MLQKEQIAHDLAVQFAKHDLDEYVAEETEQGNIVDDYMKRVFLTNSYKEAYSQIKDEFSK